MPVPLTKEEAIQIVKEQSYEDKDAESDYFGQKVIRQSILFSSNREKAYIGGILKEAEVIGMINRSEAVYWALHSFNFNLCVDVDNKYRYFNAQPPEGFDFQIST